MTDLSTIAKEAKELARERLGKTVVQDVEVSDYFDESGERAYKVVYVISDFDPNILTTKNRAAVFRALVGKLSERGDERFPFVTYVTKAELAEATADD